MLMSVQRAGGPAHLSERGLDSRNAWAASEGASLMFKSSSPGHLPTLMRSCAGEDFRLPEKRALVRSAGGAAVRRAGRGASGLPAVAAALIALRAQGAGILAAEALPTCWRGGAEEKVKLRSVDKRFFCPFLAVAVVTLKLYRTFGPKDSSYISDSKSRGRGGPWMRRFSGSLTAP